MTCEAFDLSGKILILMISIGEWGGRGGLRLTAIIVSVGLSDRRLVLTIDWKKFESTSHLRLTADKVSFDLK